MRVGDRVRSTATGLEYHVTDTSPYGWPDGAVRLDGAEGWSDPASYELVEAAEREELEMSDSGMRILFYGDLQIDASKVDYHERVEQTLAYLVELVETINPDYVINLGDTFETFSTLDVRSLLSARDWMREIGQAVRSQPSPEDPPTGFHYVLLGNHDATDQEYRRSAIEVFEDATWGRTAPVLEPKLIGTPYGSILLAPYGSTLEDLRQVVQEDGGYSPFVAAGHVDIAEVQLSPKVSAEDGIDPSDLESLLADGALWFNGHYHAPQQVGERVHIVGSPLYKDFRDTWGARRGFLLWDSEDGIQRIPNPHTYFLQSFRVETEPELQAALDGVEQPSETKVKVFCPSPLIPVATDRQDEFLWLGAHPTDSDVLEVDHLVDISVNEDPRKILAAAVAEAPERLEQERLRRHGEEIFDVVIKAPPAKPASEPLPDGVCEWCGEEHQSPQQPDGPGYCHKPEADRPIDMAGLPSRLVTAAERNGIERLSEIAELGDDVKNWSGVGKKTWQKTKEVLDRWRAARSDPKPPHRIILFSGGAGSYTAARRVAEQHGTDKLTLLFADTLMEDGDLYRFLEEAAADVGGRLVQIADGRTPWEVFHDKRFLGNSQSDPCSRILKRELCDDWIAERFSPFETVVSIGIDWTEMHRYERLAPRKRPWVYDAPLIAPPLIEKDEMLETMQERGIRPPRLYEEGFPHNNCAGFCIKAGQAHFKHLYETRPELYLWHEEQEQKLRCELEKDVSILRKQVDGTLYNITLRDFREHVIEADGEIDPNDWGGCGCFVDV